MFSYNESNLIDLNFFSTDKKENQSIVQMLKYNLCQI